MSQSSSKRSANLLLSVFICLTLLLCFGGYVLYSLQKKSITLEKQNELAAISKLKVDQIANWRNEHLENAQNIFNNQTIISHIAEYNQGIHHNSNYRIITKWMREIMGKSDYSMAFLIDPTGKVILNTNLAEPLTESGKRIIKQAQRSKDIVLSEQIKYNDKNVYIELSIPLYLKPEKRKEFVGVALLRIDPDNSLYPLILSWPTPSRSSENLLVRKEGDSLLFLNDLQHKKKTALRLLNPKAGFFILANHATTRKTGILEGIDYSGIKVLADIQPVPGCSWFVITKVDIDEIYHPILKLAIWICAITFLLILISGLIIYMLWSLQLNKSERERKALLQHFDYVVKYANDIICLADLQGNIYEVNDKAVNTYGYTYNELLRLNLSKLQSAESEDLLFQQIKLLNETDGYIFETIHICKDGKRFPVEVSGRILNISGVKYIHVIIRDISERKKAEEEIAIYQQHLQDLVEERTADLRKINLQLKKDIAERQLVENKLRQNEQRLKFQFENSPLAIVEWNADFLTTQWSKEAEHIFGWKAFEAIGISIDSLKLIHEESIPILSDILARLINGIEKVVIIECKNYTKEGTPIECIWYSSLLIDEIGEVASVMSLVEDITERNRAEEELIKAKTDLEIRVQERTAELAKSEERFRSTLDNLVEGCMFISHNWEYLYVNDSITKQINKSREKLIGHKMMEIYPGVEGMPVYEGFMVTMEKRIPHNFVIDFKFSDGHISWYDLRVEPVTEGIFVRSTDITEQKLAIEKLRASEEGFRTLAESIPQFVWIARTDGMITYFNQRWVEYTGLALEESYGTGWSTPYHPEDKQLAKDAWKRALETGERYDLESRLRQFDGEYHWFVIRGVPLRDSTGAISMWYGTCTEIDNQKQAEKEIKELNEELEHRVYERTFQLQTANKELEAFSYSVSHDLRAPLRSIDGWSLALLEDCYDQLDEQGRKYLDRVRNETQHMGFLIDDLLKLSHVSRAELRKVKIDLSILAEDITKELQKELKDRRFEIIIQPGMVTFADPNLLKIALTNLLDNAFKFTRKQPLARIEIGQSDIDEKRTYWVRDNGVGFDMAYSKKLFGAFQRMHKQSEFPGTGIGLATVQRIIHRHDGLIWADSKLNQGTTFYFTLIEETL